MTVRPASLEAGAPLMVSAVSAGQAAKAKKRCDGRIVRPDRLPMPEKPMHATCRPRRPPELSPVDRRPPFLSHHQAGGRRTGRAKMNGGNRPGEGQRSVTADEGGVSRIGRTGTIRVTSPASTTSGNAPSA